MSKTRVEQAAEYLRTKGWVIAYVDDLMKFSAAPSPKRTPFVCQGRELEAIAKEAGWGGETVSGK